MFQVQSIFNGLGKGIKFLKKSVKFFKSIECTYKHAFAWYKDMTLIWKVEPIEEEHEEIILSTDSDSYSK